MIDNDLSDSHGVVDASTRSELIVEHGVSYFVEAGAGSGKTTVLVARIIELLRCSAVTLDSVAAITFTERAALELRDRLGRVLQREIEKSSSTEEERARFEQALIDLDIAPIGTLHAFAQRILRSFTSECGLPPVFRLADSVETAEIEAEGWLAFTTALEREKALARPLQRLMTFGIGLEHWRDMAASLENDRDRIRADLLSIDHGGSLDIVRTTVSALGELVSAVNSAIESYPGTDPVDSLLEQLQERKAEVELDFEELENGNEVDVVDYLASVLVRQTVFVAKNKGRKQNWGDLKPVVISAITEKWTNLKELARTVVALDLAALRDRMILLAMERRDERKRRGVVSFDDLLTIALELLRDPESGPRCREQLRERYPVIMVDEFQDTDPVQVELLWLITSEHSGSTRDSSESATVDQPSWFGLSPKPGSLFLVGDPQQSIYRFRHADLHLYSSVREILGSGLGRIKALTTNFRSTSSIVDFNNRCFAHLFERVASKWETLDPPRILTLHAFAELEPPGPAVSVIGPDVLTLEDLQTLKNRRGVVASEAGDELTTEHKVSASSLALYEAMVIADTIESAVLSDQPWYVRSGENEVRPARLGDVAILVQRHASALPLEEELIKRGVAVRSDRSSSVYELVEVQEVVMTLRALADPTDSLSIVSALRSSLFGCSDTDLLRYARAEGSWSVDEPARLPSEAPASVVEALRDLLLLRRATQKLPPSSVLSLVLEERRVLEVASSELRFRDVLIAFRYLVEEARVWFESTGGTFREYVDYLTRRIQGEVRTSEATLSDLDDDAVNIMTIHAAKGLEFPIVVVAGQSKNSRPQKPKYRHFVNGESLECRVGIYQSDGFDACNLREVAEGEAETARLLYVAYTRAQDHLVVSLVRDGEEPEPDQAEPKEARSLARLMAPSVRQAGGFRELRLQGAPTIHRTQNVGPVLQRMPSFVQWNANHARLVSLFDSQQRLSVSYLLEAGKRASSMSTTERSHTPLIATPFTQSDLWVGGDGRNILSSRTTWTSVEGQTVASEVRRDELGTLVHLLLGRLDFGQPLGALQRQARDLLEYGPFPMSTRELVAAIVEQVISSDLIPLVSGTRCLNEVPIFACLTSARESGGRAGPNEPKLPNEAAIPDLSSSVSNRGGSILEGVIDLLSIGERRVTIVEFKTRASTAPFDLDRMVDRRDLAREQCALYGWALKTGGGVAVDDAVVLYVSPVQSLLDRVDRFSERVAEINDRMEDGRYDPSHAASPR
jgi:ATP-dependent exoDNAse (exonuclease V) beta subunit